MDNLKLLQQILREELQQPGLQVSAQTRATDVEGWDSMRHLQIILRIEREWGVRFSTRDILAVKNVGELVELITRSKSK